MAMPERLKGKLKLPLISAPMFLVSGPELVKACCNAGIIGSFPSLNARPIEQLDEWLEQMNAEQAANSDMAPYAMNIIVHRSNPRVEEDVARAVRHKVPIVITSVGHPGDVVEKVHAYGGLVFHDVIHIHHAKKAIEAGVDGVILVTNGAGGHAGTINPFTLIPQVREFFDGCILMAGTMSNGRAIRAAEVLGADFAYMGTRFIATKESYADQAYKDMLVECEASDIVYTNQVSGINANFMKPSLDAAGIDPVAGRTKDVKIGQHKPEDESKAWKTVWSAGQGVGEIHDVPTVGELVDRLRTEYDAAAKTPIS